jgi:hypothetical protein
MGLTLTSGQKQPAAVTAAAEFYGFESLLSPHHAAAAAATAAANARSALMTRFR